MSVYGFRVRLASGPEISLSDYMHKVLLIVNVASNCGYTNQYYDLEMLYKLYKRRGFFILGFPCNQFGFQEPGSDSEILKFCHTVYNVSFPILSKIDVDGENAHPLYKYLIEHSPWNIRGRIRWNFTKFLIDRKGRVVDRYESKISPVDFRDKIEKLLKMI
ncbi:glutathione peroxidase [Borrelia miyamotoi]|uniref:Glutathione peroxidase n=1 Tax=Borrelia miyamotoi TaxID=47466 RepID=A0AAQ2WWS6_9SPIR|nr:glutathione peroxidase [Borrelia miyamotoi]AGT27479.1 glutathione peroxidase [Borrelia miyamotoi LB-2001]AJA58663.1 glutathione peroxidase [Borrelia miyamotoi]AOW95745.1 glutathione peroxidase [Borrelia miyamotoi]QTL83629.1 glutathione peroxidase [Borrelia miyamotoi]WAZ85070.1 glutathione peroxidase [Borrelia miyamotoi]